MESGIHSSFIPHDTGEQGARPRESSGNLMDFLALIAAIVFVSSIILALGVFLYQQFLDTSAKSKVAQLDRAKAAFDPALIQELTRLDDRMRVADEILGNHEALSIFFHMLEQVTLTTVSFRSLSFEAADPQNITIKMMGVAESVNAVALQADLFSKNGVIVSPIFSNIDRQPDGVHFTLTASINPGSIRYTQLIPAESAGGAGAQQSALAPNQQIAPTVQPGALQGGTVVAPVPPVE